MAMARTVSMAALTAVILHAGLLAPSSPAQLGVDFLLADARQNPVDIARALPHRAPRTVPSTVQMTQNRCAK